MSMPFDSITGRIEQSKPASCESTYIVFGRNPRNNVLRQTQRSIVDANLGMRYNWLTCPDALSAPVKSTPLQYLNVLYTPISQSTLNSLWHAAIASLSLLWFSAIPLVKGGHGYADVKAGQEAVRLKRALREHLLHNVRDKYDGMEYETFESEVKRFLLSPEDVRLIDSVYRNRDAGMARRGVKVLNKWWDDGDDTLARPKPTEKLDENRELRDLEHREKARER